MLLKNGTIKSGAMLGPTTSQRIVGLSNTASTASQSVTTPGGKPLTDEGERIASKVADGNRQAAARLDGSVGHQGHRAIAEVAQRSVERAIVIVITRGFIAWDLIADRLFGGTVQPQPKCAVGGQFQRIGFNAGRRGDRDDSVAPVDGPKNLRGQALALAERMLDWYKEKNQKKRLGRIIDDIGLDTFKAELGLPAA